MGAWGAGSFENDWAMDWVGDLLESADTSLVLRVLKQVIEHGGNQQPTAWGKFFGRRTDWLTANLSSKAVAAAEIVAAWRGHPSQALPERVGRWLEINRGRWERDDAKSALQALEIIKTNSELRELWVEGDAAEWFEGIEDLEKRLRLCSND